MTIIESGGGHYTVIYDGAYQPPVPIATKCTGRMVRKHHNFVANAIVMLNSDTSPLPAPPMIAAIHETGEMPDCNTLNFTIDLFAGYFWGKTPFVDSPDFYPAPTPIYETYKRMVEP